MPRELPYKDYEGAMVKSQLMKIENYAKKLNEMIKDDDEIESWVQAKLTKVDAYMGDVKHYLDYAYNKKFEDGGEIDPTIRAFGAIDFESLEKIFSVKLFGLTEEETENILEELRREWIMEKTAEERQQILDEYDIDLISWDTYNSFSNGGSIDSIEITFEEEDDRRFPSVEIEIKSKGNTYDIYGNIKSFHTGRAEEYEFEPSWFADNDSEMFYSQNWEDIEEVVIDSYYKQLRKQKRKRI